MLLPKPEGEDGRLVPHRRWVHDFLDTLAAFPNGAHDDDVDALSQLLAQWRKDQESNGFLEYAKQVVAAARARDAQT